jgi:hypothetical protein
MVNRLPVDIFFILRDYLFNPSDNFSEKWGLREAFDKYSRSEARWSWRNFLSVSHNPTWRLIRKITMVWNLSKDSSRKYLVNDEFRNFVNSQMTQPDHQLFLSFFSIESKSRIRNGVCIPSYYSSALSNLEYLHSLRITNCDLVTHLSGCSKLKLLTLACCRNLISVDELPHLRELNFVWMPNGVLTCFPLENLLVLKIRFLSREQEEGLELLRKNQNQLQNLRELCLLAGFLSFSLTDITLHSLEILELGENCDIVDLTGFPKLRSFSVDNVRHLRGKEIIFPQLTVYYCLTPDPFLELNIKYMQNLRTLRCNAENLSQAFLNDANSLPLLKELILVSNCFLPSYNITNNKLQLLDIKMGVKSLVVPLDGKDPPSLFRLVCDSGHLEDISSLSNFQHISQVRLSNSIYLQNIDCLRKVSYLSIISCPNIKSFSCVKNFEQLRYLEITRNSYFSNDDIKGVRKLSYLRLAHCPRITKISGLTTVRFVSFDRLNYVKEITFEGTDYVTVSLTHCPLLSMVEVTGWIATLNVSECPEIIPNKLQNYEFLLNEPHFFPNVS